MSATKSAINLRAKKIALNDAPKSSHYMAQETKTNSLRKSIKTREIQVQKNKGENSKKKGQKIFQKGANITCKKRGTNARKKSPINPHQENVKRQ